MPRSEALSVTRGHKRELAKLQRAMKGYEREATLAIYSSLRATAKAAADDSRSNLSQATGVILKPLRKRVRWFARMRQRKPAMRTWIGVGYTLGATEHESIAKIAKREGFKLTRWGGREYYIKRPRGGGDSRRWEFFQLNLADYNADAILLSSALHHFRTTFPQKLRREAQTRLARLTGRSLQRKGAASTNAGIRKLLRIGAIE